MRLLILGCGGFIGSHLLERLLSSGRFDICGVDKRMDKIRHLPPSPTFRLFEQDVYTFSGLAEEVARADAVISLTAICNPAQYNTEPINVIEANYELPARIVRLCAEHKTWLIQFGTSEVYGKTPAALPHADPTQLHILDADQSHLILGPIEKQRWTYACAKQLLERLVFAYGAERKLPFTIIRPFNFIGPRMDYIPGIDGEGTPRVLACFMDALMFDKPLQLVEGGTVRRVFTAISDAVEAIDCMLRQPDKAQGHIFNIGNPDNEVSIRDLALLMAELYPEVSGRSLSRKSIIVPVTAEAFYGVGYDDSDRRIPDITPARKLLGWNPVVPLREALQRAMEGFVQHYRQS